MTEEADEQDSLGICTLQIQKKEREEKIESMKKKIASGTLLTGTMLSLLFIGVLTSTVAKGSPGSPKIGLKYRVHFSCLNVTDNKNTCPNDNRTFSVQMNYFLKLSNGSVYWVQSGYDVYYTGEPCSGNQEVYIKQYFAIWWVNVTEGSDQIKIVAAEYFGGVHGGVWKNMGKPSTFTLEPDTYINRTRIMMSGEQATDASGRNSEVMDWKNQGVSGQIVNTADDGDVRKNQIWATRNTRPELVWVGVKDYSTAKWGTKTAGWVEGYDAISCDPQGYPRYFKDNKGDVKKNSDHTTGEESQDLFWKWDPANERATCENQSGSDTSGIGFYCDKPVGGISLPVDKLALLAPYVGLASTIIVATVATAVYVRRVMQRREKQ